MLKNILKHLTILFALISPLLVKPMILKAQESKLAEVTVSGNGQTKDQALQNALKNAIEQAFGTFISSNTNILNDELVKDEIISVSNGNIQKYEVLAEVQEPDGEWSNTVKAIVSVDKLISFCQNKGMQVEFQGGLFTMNIKQQILYENNEVQAIDNICLVLEELGKKSFDYSVVAGEPLSQGGQAGKWIIPITVNIKPNDNFYSLQDYLISTLKGLSLSESDVLNYIKLNKEVYSVVFDPMSRGKSVFGPSIFYLRNEKSLLSLCNFLVSLSRYAINVNINNSIDTIDFSLLYESNKELYQKRLKQFNYGRFDYNKPPFKIDDTKFRPIICGGYTIDECLPSLYQIDTQNTFAHRTECCKELIFDGKFLAHTYVLYKFFPVYYNLLNNSLIKCSKCNHTPVGLFNLIISFKINTKNLSINRPRENQSPSGMNINKSGALISLEYEDIRTMDELEKIKQYKIQSN